jgi:hypothetical protein
MISSVLLLAVVAAGFGIMFGGFKSERLFQFLIWLLVAPLLLCAVLNPLIELYFGLPHWVQILSFMFLPVAFYIILRLLLPRAKWLGALEAAVFNTLVFALAFPLRLVWRVATFTFERERRRTKLNPYRPVVGSRPPLVNERRVTPPKSL